MAGWSDSAAGPDEILSAVPQAPPAEAFALQQLQPGHYWPEMAFTFAASQLEATALDHTLRQHRATKKK